MSRGCEVCGPGRIDGCYRCSSTLGHRHLVLKDRRGRVVGQVAVCDVHGQVPTETPASAQRPAPDASTLAKRRRDRERRRAHRVVLDRHASEVASELARIRQEAS